MATWEDKEIDDSKVASKGRAEILVRRIAATKLMVVTIVIKEV